MLTAHQRIAWARRWPGYTLRIEEAPRSLFTVASPSGDESGGFPIRGFWVPFRSGAPRPGIPVERAAMEIVEMLNAA